MYWFSIGVEVGQQECRTHVGMGAEVGAMRF
jgi:hypothetical protein